MVVTKSAHANLAADAATGGRLCGRRRQATENRAGDTGATAAFGRRHVGVVKFKLKFK